MIYPEIYGLSGSSEFQAAVWLQKLLEAGTGPSEKGTIRLHVKPHMRQQLDVLMHGWFSAGFMRDILLPDVAEPQQVTFLDILVAIEVKTHRKDGVRLSIANAIVKYPEGESSASDESHHQALSAKKFIRRECGWTPWVCNLIFFPNLVKADLPQSTSTNYLAGDSTFEDFLEKLCANNPSIEGQSRNIEFSCAGGGTKPLQARYEHLHDVLGSFQQTAQQRVASRPATAFNQISRSNQGSHSNQSNQVSQPEQSTVLRVPAKRFRLLRYLFFFFAVALAILFVRQAIFVSASALHSLHTKLIQSQRLAQTAITTCMSQTPSCSWQSQSTYHRGMTIYFHFEGLDQNVLSVHIQNPRGATSILPFHKAPDASGGKTVYLAKMPLGSRALTGSYSITADARDTTSQIERSFTENFTIEP